MGIDHSSLTDQVDYFDALTEDQIVKARRIVAANSVNGVDCAELLEILGIHPTKSEEEECPRSFMKLPSEALSKLDSTSQE